MNALRTQIWSNHTYNVVNALLDFKNVNLASAHTKDKTIQKLTHQNLLTDLAKDNTWAVPTYLENKQMLTHNSICSQFVSTAFCKIAIERFMKVEKLGSTTEFGKKIINSFAVCDLLRRNSCYVGGFITYSGVTPPFYRKTKSVLSHKETLER